MRSACSVLLSLSLLSSHGEAQAADPPTTQPSADSATSLLRQASGRHAAADFQGAIALLQRAAATSTKPTVRAQVHFFLGINHEVLGDVAAARQAFGAALVHDPTLQIDPRRFRSLAVSLFREIRARLSGRIEVDAPSNVRVELDRSVVGNGRVVRQVSIGTHEIRLLSADGEELLARSVIVAPTGVVKVKAPPPPTSRPTQISAPQSQPTSAPVIAQPLEPRRRLWTWIAAGGAVASLAVATGFALAARDDYNDWENEWRAGQDEARWDALANSGKRKELVANVLFVTAGILAVTSTVAFFLEGKREKPRRSGAVVMSAGGTSLAVAF